MKVCTQVCEKNVTLSVKWESNGKVFRAFVLSAH